MNVELLELAESALGDLVHEVVFVGRATVGPGFHEDQESGVICRWRHSNTGLVLDATPSRADILGFENKRWLGFSRSRG